MSRDDDIRLRPGRIGSRGKGNERRFVGRVRAAVEKAGGRAYPATRARGPRFAPSASRFGRGRSATVAANRQLGARSRGAVVKARVVRLGRGAPMATHLRYLQREGVSHDGEKGKLFNAREDDIERKVFAERCKDDRHHFRFIVSPDDARELGDLKGFARDLMGQMERDLGTKLDWVGIDHWNTEHPHIHIIVRGRLENGQDLVISRDYISEGMRARARELATLELGPRTERDIARSLESQIETERWTQLDRALVRHADTDGVIDLRPESDAAHDEYRFYKVGRLRKLERMGLAEPAGIDRWTLAADAEPTLRALGERGDIIKRLHQSLAAQGLARAEAQLSLDGEHAAHPVIGRLVARGLDNELTDSAYAIIDGVDGRVHHVRLPNLDVAGDSAPGSIVALRKYQDARGRERTALAVRSDLSIEAQVTAKGATWLDRQALSRDGGALAETGFGAEARAAIEKRVDHLSRHGLAERRRGAVWYARNLLDRLRRDELAAAGAKLQTDTGLALTQPGEGDAVSGVYRQRLALASGRFAMIDNGLGFSLVPWSPSLERHLGQHVSGIARGDTGVDWSFGRKLGISI